jgi:predicted 2-oxoglutarate/Fe(II)-dependent dioxygenase YbiX
MPQQGIVGRQALAIANLLDETACLRLRAGRLAAIHLREIISSDDCQDLLQVVLAGERAISTTDDTLVAKVPLTAISGPRGAQVTDVERPIVKEIGAKLAHSVLAPMLGDAAPAAGAPPAVFRIYRPGARLRPHIDRSNEPALGDRCATGRFAVNLYVSAGQGGGLLLWDIVLSAEDYEPHRFLELADFVERFGPPTLRLSPAPGDLILFNSEQLHAVEPVSAGLRMTLSMFLGFDADERPTLFG